MKNDIYEFLKTIDKDFPIPISNKTNLGLFSEKLYQKATLCIHKEEGRIVGMVAGYTEDLINNMAYICIVGVLNKYRGKGIASKLVNDFVEICKNKGIKAVHLYTHKSNLSALAMYRKIGFSKFLIDNEIRNEDIHLIKRININFIAESGISD